MASPHGFFYVFTFLSEPDASATVFHFHFTFAHALVNLAYAGFHACLIVFLDFRIRENDGRRSAAQ
jgi:hypothetical protein